MTAKGDLVGRLPGCVWDARLFDSDAVTEQGGVVTGSPTIDRGVMLNGVDESITYLAPELYSTEITFVCEFLPDFAPDEDENRHIYSSSGDSYRVLKRNNTDSNTLYISVGHTVIVEVSQATYSPHWKIGQKNLLIVSAASGDNHIYLNGYEINSNSTAWTPQTSTDNSKMVLGKKGSASVAYFDGKITQFFIVNRKWTAQEAKDWWAGRTFNYRKRALLYLPMRVAEHNALTGKTLDRSNNNHHAAFGAGTAEPTKLIGRRGYSFDGADYMDCGSSITGADSEWTVSALFLADGLANYTITGNYHHDSGEVGIAIRIRSSGASWVCCGHSGDLEYIENSNSYQPNQWVHFAGCRKGDTLYAYLDGIEQSVTGASTNVINMSTNWQVGRSLTGGATLEAFTGDISNTAYWPEALTPTQIALEHRRLIEELHGDP